MTKSEFATNLHTKLVFQPARPDKYSQHLTNALLNGYIGDTLTNLSNALLHEEQNNATEGNLPTSVESLFKALERTLGVTRSLPDQKGNITLSHNGKMLSKATIPTEPEDQEMMEEIILGSLKDRLSILATSLQRDKLKQAGRSNLVTSVKAVFKGLERDWEIKRIITK